MFFYACHFSFPSRLGAHYYSCVAHTLHKALKHCLCVARSFLLCDSAEHQQPVHDTLQTLMKQNIAFWLLPWVPYKAIQMYRIEIEPVDYLTVAIVLVI